MRFEPPLVSGRFLRRYKRFFADVRLDTGEEVVAHCANPGSMKTLLVEEAPVFLSRHDNPSRKLPYTWEIVEVPNGRVYVNPARANDLVVESLKRGTVAELIDYPLIEREIRFGRSRLDVRLRGAGPDCYVEVKNVTLDLGYGRSAFPDSVTERGRKHLGELIDCKAAGYRAVLFFVAARTDAARVEPADAIDPEYGQALRAAVSRGVELLAYRVDISRDQVTLGSRVPVVLP
jgi:sugar fermentation stimulation protein A